jgi:hypothetical protein
MMKQANTLETNAAALKRWRTKLKRAMTAIEKLERQRKRLEAKSVKPMEALPAKDTFPKKDAKAGFAVRASEEQHAITRAVLDPRLDTIGANIVEETVDLSATKVSHDLALPSFLDRTKVDPVAEQIREEQADIKRRKAKGRIEKMKAKQRGDLKRMPLTGRAALEAIRNA